MNNPTPETLAVEKVRFFGQHHGEVSCSAFSPDGRTLLTASDDGCVYGWETKSKRLLWRLAGHKGPVKFCRFSPDGLLFASSSCDCTIRLWDVARAKCLQVLKGHQRSVETVSFSPDAKQLASGGWDKRVMLWEVQSGHNLRLLVGHRDSVQSSDFSPTADCLATGSWDSTVRIWDLRVATPAVSYQELEGHSGNISCLCYSGSGLLVSQAAQDSRLVSAGPLIMLGIVVNSEHAGPIPLGSELSLKASGSWDKTIRIWKPTTSSLLLQLKGHTTWVKSLAFSPDELRLASAGYSHMVKVWDCNTGKCLETLKVPSLNLGLPQKRPGRSARGLFRLHRGKPKPGPGAAKAAQFGSRRVCSPVPRGEAAAWAARLAGQNRRRLRSSRPFCAVPARLAPHPGFPRSARDPRRGPRSLPALGWRRIPARSPWLRRSPLPLSKGKRKRGGAYLNYYRWRRAQPMASRRGSPAPSVRRRKRVRCALGSWASWLGSWVRWRLRKPSPWWAAEVRRQDREDCSSTVQSFIRKPNVSGLCRSKLGTGGLGDRRIFFFETGSHYAALAGLKLVM